MTDYELSHDKNQILIDIHPKTKKLNPWQKHRKNTDALAASCRRIEKIDTFFKGRAARLENCSTWLEFRKYESGDKALNRANFCRYRLCPMCSWRRSLKMFGQTSQVMDVAESQRYRFLFVTLTVRNCSGVYLGRTINSLFKGFSNLLRQGKYKKVVKGWMRTLEVTHNVILGDKSFDTYHPHLHVILVVKESYFKKHGKDYIQQADMIQDWRKALGVDYDPGAHIKAVKQNDKSGSIKEVSKYVTKAGDLLTWDDDLTDSGVWHLDNALAGRRLVSYGGILKQIKADLNLDDVETGDLVNVDGENPLRDDLAYVLEMYHWRAGYGLYIKKQQHENSNTKKETQKNDEI